MSIFTLKDIKLSSFLKLLLFIGLSIGVTFGIIMFVMSLFGANVIAKLGTIQFEGVMAGVMSIVIIPIVLAIIMLLFGMLGYLPFKLLLRSIEGMQLYIDGDLEKSKEQKSI